MGYWDKHPMAGDTPLDVKGHIDDTYVYPLMQSEGFFEDEGEEDDITESPRYAEFLLKALPNIVKAYEDGTDDGLDEAPFVVPFMVVENGIKIEDEDLSHRVRAMIGDGGAADRGYGDGAEDDDEDEQDDQPTDDTPFDPFSSPQGYADQLEKAWDNLMTGRATYDDLERGKGLFEQIAIKLAEGKGGGANVD